MMRSLNIGHWVALVCMAALVASCGSTRETAWDTTSESVQLDEAAQAQVAELMASAAAAWANRGDPAQAKAAVDAWSKAAEIDSGLQPRWCACRGATQITTQTKST